MEPAYSPVGGLRRPAVDRRAGRPSDAPARPAARTVRCEQGGQGALRRAQLSLPPVRLHRVRQAGRSLRPRLFQAGAERGPGDRRFLLAPGYFRGRDGCGEGKLCLDGNLHELRDRRRPGRRLLRRGNRQRLLRPDAGPRLTRRHACLGLPRLGERVLQHGRVSDRNGRHFLHLGKRLGKPSGGRAHAPKPLVGRQELPGGLRIRRRRRHRGGRVARPHRRIQRRHPRSVRLGRRRRPHALFRRLRGAPAGRTVAGRDLLRSADDVLGDRHGSRTRVS